MAKVTLDIETFKALASATRLLVLRALDERRKTLAELTKELELNKATIHEHLQMLVAVGLVKKRDDEGRKWIYYELTWQGERLLHPQETTTFAVMLGLGVAAAGGGVFMLGRALDLWMQERELAGMDEGALPESSAPDERAGMAAEESDSSADEPESQESAAAPAPEPPAEPAPIAEELPQATDADGFFDDPDGVFGLLLVITSILLVAISFLVRKTRK